MLDESSNDTLLSKTNNKDIWKWHANDFCGYLKRNALSLSFAIYNILNKREKCQNLNQEKISVEIKTIFRNISLLFFGVNVNVVKRISLQVIWNMLQSLKQSMESSTCIKKWFLKLIGRITMVKVKASWHL